MEQRYWHSVYKQKKQKAMQNPQTLKAFQTECYRLYNLGLFNYHEICDLLGLKEEDNNEAN